MANSSCNQCAAKTCCSSVSRRSFLAQAGVASLSAFAPSSLRAADPARQQPIRNTLKVQPVLIYNLAKRREATSWRSWGALQTEQDIADEKQRIGRELKQMSAGIDFPLDVRPIEEAQTVDQAARIAQGDHDVVLQYAASGSGCPGTPPLTPSKAATSANSRGCARRSRRSNRCGMIILLRRYF